MMNFTHDNFAPEKKALLMVSSMMVLLSLTTLHPATAGQSASRPSWNNPTYDSEMGNMRKIDADLSEGNGAGFLPGESNEGEYQALEAVVITAPAPAGLYSTNLKPGRGSFIVILRPGLRFRHPDMSGDFKLYATNKEDHYVLKNNQNHFFDAKKVRDFETVPGSINLAMVPEDSTDLQEALAQLPVLKRTLSDSCLMCQYSKQEDSSFYSAQDR